MQWLALLWVWASLSTGSRPFLSSSTLPSVWRAQAQPRKLPRGLCAGEGELLAVEEVGDLLLLELEVGSCQFLADGVEVDGGAHRRGGGVGDVRARGG